MIDGAGARRAWALGALVALCGALWAITPFAASLEEEVGLTWLLHTRGPREPPRGVAIVAIDRAAAQALGQSSQPSEWPRTLQARLIDALAHAGARAIAFDVSFATPARDPADDRALALALARAGNVVLLDFLEEETGPGIRIQRELVPIPELAAAAAAHGPFPLPKSGHVRAYWPYAPEGNGHATLPVLAYAIYRNTNAAVRASAAPEEARYLDFYGPPRSVPTIGFDAVLAAASDERRGAAWLRKTFEGRAVFVGFSARQPSEQDRVRDDYHTVFSRSDGLDLSGVEIAATAFGNMLEGRVPTPLPRTTQVLVLAIWAMLLGALCAALPGGYALAAVGAASVGYALVALARFDSVAQWLPLVTPLLGMAPLALFASATWRHVEERHERQRLFKVLGDLLPPAVVDTLVTRIRRAAAPQQPVFGVFVMTDIEGFTTIVEGMSSAAATHMLNRYFEMIFAPIERNGGSVSDIHGDAMVAFWLGDERRACQAACRAALEIAELTGRPDGLPGWPCLPTRIGVHGGPFSLARVGASRHYEYRAVGDAANTASRIEALSKHLGTHLLASEDVVAHLDDHLTRPVGEFLLIGKSKSLRIHELVGPRSAAPEARRRLCAAFADALSAYEARRWDDAAAQLTEILHAFPDDRPSRFYLELARRHASEPLAQDWNAVVRMTEK